MCSSSIIAAKMKAEARVLKVAARLEERYGKLEWKIHGNPLEILIKTVLSQNTNDNNRDRAYRSLKEAFPTYAAIVDAGVSEVAEAIKVGGLHHQKARRIKQTLEEIRAERGAFDLSYLTQMGTGDGLKELLRFDGVGKKTAGVVLLFGLKRPYFPVDTHINRISRRLELVEKGKDPHDKLNRIVPDELKYQLHLHLIRHGRETCKAIKPRCEVCVINDLCSVPQRGLPI